MHPGRLREVVNVRERGHKMGAEAERQDVKKAMAFDLYHILDAEPSKETYTKDEIKKLIWVYITTSDQK